MSEFEVRCLTQSVAPSCLNRDDTGSPKDCQFGGVRRARVSSQSFKRAIRERFRTQEGLAASMGVRTKRLVEGTAQRLALRGRDEEIGRKVARNLLNVVFGKDMFDGKATDKTKYLLFLSPSEVQAFGEIAEGFWDELSAMETQNAETPSGEEPEEAAPKASRKGAKTKKTAGSKELLAAVKGLFGKTPGVDLALFGRMIADRPDDNVDGVCQVAHAISTHQTAKEVDFFTALDDLKPDDTSGSDMMGVVEFNSACLYRYLTLDWDSLVSLLGNEAFARTALEGFLEAAVQALPSGRQNSFAAHNLPSLAFACVHDGQRFSLVNAFEKPVKPRDGLVEESVRRMDEYLGLLEKEYGRYLVGTGAVKLHCGPAAGGGLVHLGERADNLEAWIQAILRAL